MMTEPRAGFIDWINDELVRHKWPLQRAIILVPLAGDAGCRRYFRLETECSGQEPGVDQGVIQQGIIQQGVIGCPNLLAVDAPPQKEDSHAFVELGQYLRDNGIHTPEVIAADTERGFLLLEDFGDNLLQQALNPDSVELLYGECLMTLLRLQQCQQPPALVAAYDGDFLRSELNLFEHWFVEALLESSLDATERQLLDDTFKCLEVSALAQPQVLVHRDYHSRNLLVTEGGAPGVVDFQGALIGPITYDLVSLLRDCYIRWPRDDVRRWALAYGNMALEVGILPSVSEREFLQWFDWMGLQRHIKVLGIFSRLALRDGKLAYLQDLPLVIRYLLDVAEEYPQLAEFVDWFKARLLPKICEQDWYKDYRTAGED